MDRRQGKSYSSDVAQYKDLRWVVPVVNHGSAGGNRREFQICQAEPLNPLHSAPRGSLCTSRHVDLPSTSGPHDTQIMNRGGQVEHKFAGF